MPKSSTNEDRAKVKLRVIEFDLEGSNAAVENSIRQLTHALTARTNGSPLRTLAQKPPKEFGPAVDQDDVEETTLETEDLESEESAPETPRATKAKTTYKARIPNYLHDLDINGSSGSVKFKDFSIKKSPSTNAQRHLLAAYWLKEFGNSPTINIDKVFTCYRTADWPTNQADWDVGFRAQVRTNRFRRVAPGEYAINPVGEDDVRKMDGTG